MSTINPTNTPVANPQLAGILGSVPMPAAVFSPQSSVNVGADFTIPQFGQPGASAITGGGGQGTVMVGGDVNGSTLGAGAQPAPPNGTAVGVGANGVPVADATTVPVANVATTTTASSTTPSTPENGSPLAEAISGFGKASRHEPIKASIDGATFGFPSFKATSKTLTAPPIKWGPGWSKVEKNGMWWMEHTNGSKAVPAVEYRITPRPADKVQAIKVANGWGKKFPDGTILVFDRKEGPYRLDPKGNKHKVGLGVHTFGGVKVRVFEASVVRTLDKDGKVDVFDSRGNVSKGTTRHNIGAGLGSADAGATMGGGKTESGGGKTESGGGKTEAGGAPGKLVGGGHDLSQFTVADIQEMTGIAREIINEIRSGNVDPARLQALQARLAKLPSGILQAAGAAGTMTSSGLTVAAPGSTGNSGAAPPAAGTAGGGGTPPTPGVDANATTKELAAGTTAKVAASLLPAELHGKQARFAQLPEEVQQAIATAFGSDRGTAAFKADQLFAFASDGSVRVVEAGTVYLRHQAQVVGAGPGEDRTLTMRPNRQPGGSASVSGGGSASASGGANTSTPTVAGGGNGHATTTTSNSGAPAAASGGGATGPATVQLFKPGGDTRHVDFGGLSGSFTFSSLPANAKAALLEILRSGDEAASKAFASRTGTGWKIDPNAVIVMDAGFASFPNGLTMTRGQAPAPAPIAGGGPSNQSHAHDATRPPVAGSATGGGATGGNVAPGTPPPVPAVEETPSPAVGHAHGHDGHAHAH